MAAAGIVGTPRQNNKGIKFAGKHRISWACDTLEPLHICDTTNMAEGMVATSPPKWISGPTGLEAVQKLLLAIRAATLMDDVCVKVRCAIW